MAFTLADAKQLSQDALKNIVIDEFRKSALLDILPFDDSMTSGSGTSMTYSYNRITTEPTAAGRAINSDYAPQEAKTTKYYADLKIMGGSYELDRAIINNEKKVILDAVKFQASQKAKATTALFHDWFINGDSGVNPLEFDGLDKAIAGGTTEIIPAAAINLSTSANITSNWQTFTDTLRSLKGKLDGTPSIMLLNIDMYTVFQSIMDRAGINLLTKENYGREIAMWGSTMVMALGDKPGTSDPIIPIVGGETSIYMARLGQDGVHGISPTGQALLNTYLPDINSSDAVKKGAVEMISGLAVKSTRCAGVLRKIKIA